ncbi:MAG: penicillin acylase family protein [Bacteroidota bacterium]
MRIVLRFTSLLFLVVLLYALNTKFGAVPPVGKFLDPDAGFWANAEVHAPESESLSFPGLQEEVVLYFDDRRVPHIFANNESDLYFAQGYITAKHRLFQMELQAYDAAGRLSEIIGVNKTVQDRDRQTRRLGMPYGAEKAIQEMKKDPRTWASITAYSDGVNAYIESLSPGDYPIEYKILDAAPERWEPIKTAHLLKNMTRTLAGYNSDDRTSNTLAYFGEEFVDRFFTQKPKLNDPIIPNSRVWDFEAQIPEAPKSLFIPHAAKTIEGYDKDMGIGSNNWAVHGSKTKNGHPVLANDPHLSLTMPSIWHEIQLHAPGLNVYGVTLQGAPGVIIGFNEQVAWGVTNVGSDVMDWYEVQFKDESLSEYWHDGQWKPTTQRIEETRVKGAASIIDTVVYTHHGPVTKIEPEEPGEPVIYHALRWIAHEPSNDLKTFLELNRAQSYEDYVSALSHYVAPAQNFVFASNEGDIALWVNGQFPNKWKHQGRTVSDGTDARYDWQGWIPRDHVPHIKNPNRGFVSSANQESAGEAYPYYLDDDFASFERGRRINEMLAEMENITPQDMMNMHMDNFSYHAATALPELLQWLDTDSLSEEEKAFAEELANWNFFIDADEVTPGFFRRWWARFYNALFNDEFDSVDESLRYPSRDMVVEVLKENPDFYMVDNIKTTRKETLRDIATSSWSSAYADFKRRYGPRGEAWKWGFVMNNDLDHIGFIPGLGVSDVYSGGSSEAINATRGGYGPSWRMVVELGPEVKGWGVFPGGQTGNPGSPNYDAFVENWRTGNHFELNFWKTPPDNPAYQISLTKK